MGTGDGGWLLAEQSSGFDKGRRLVRLPAIGLASGLPAQARREPPRGFPCQIRCGPVTLCGSNRGPTRKSFAPADRRLKASRAGARMRRPSRRRERPCGAALNPYRKFSQGRFGAFDVEPAGSSSLGMASSIGFPGYTSFSMPVQPDPESEWWTTSDVASYLGLKVATVSAYRARGQMPDPDATIGRTHVWKPDRIIAWHETRKRVGIGGRLPGAQDE